MNLKFIVTGTGRCGTVYMAKLLTSLGVPCGHESIFRNDGINGAWRRLKEQTDLPTSYVSTHNPLTHKPLPKWFNNKLIEADSSYFAAPFIDTIDVNVIHVVRHPLDVINSFVNDVFMFLDKPPIHQKPNQEFIQKHCDLVLTKYKHPIDRAAYYWLEWNKMIEMRCRSKISSFTLHRVEEGLTDNILLFCDAIKPDSYFDNKTENSWISPGALKRRQRINWHNISSQLCNDVQNAAVRYGYKI